MMLVPRDIDAGLFGGIARALDARGEPHEAYREVRGRYRRSPRGGVWLELESAVRHDGSEVGLPVVFDLGEIASAGRAPSA